MLDMTHIIHSLNFGNNPGNRYQFNSLKDFHSEKEINEAFLGISYTYFLDVVEENKFLLDENEGVEEYFYTARMNEVILASAPMVLFR